MNPVSPWNACDHAAGERRPIPKSDWTVCTACGRVLDPKTTPTRH